MDVDEEKSSVAKKPAKSEPRHEKRKTPLKEDKFQVKEEKTEQKMPKIPKIDKPDASVKKEAKPEVRILMTVLEHKGDKFIFV